MKHHTFTLRAIPLFFLLTALVIAPLFFRGFSGLIEEAEGQATTSLNNVGLQLDSDFAESGGFTLQLQVEPAESPSPENFLQTFDDSIDLVECSVTRPASLCCLCDETTVVSGSGGLPLDVAIDIDSSGSNVLPPSAEDPEPPSDPDNLRLVAAQEVATALLTGANRVAAFNFGTLYCAGEPCPAGDPLGDFFRGLARLRSTRFFTDDVTYRFSDGYVDASQRDVVRANLSRAIWQENNGTPIFDSLLEILEDMDTSITRDSVKMIVVFSDGRPTMNMNGESDVCQLASAMNVPILAIGYGSASNLDERQDPEAVQVLQNLAACSGGTYLAIQNVSNIAEEATNLVRSITQGRLDLGCHLSDPSQILARGESVEGSVTLNFKDSSSPPQSVPFNFTPSTSAPREIPGHETDGPECPSPRSASEEEGSRQEEPTPPPRRTDRFGITLSGGCGGGD